MKLTDLNIVALDANAKTAALFSGTIDAVSGDARPSTPMSAPQPAAETMMLSGYGVPLIGFGFAANNAYLAKTRRSCGNSLPPQARFRRGGARLQGSCD